MPIGERLTIRAEREPVEWTDTAEIIGERIVVPFLIRRGSTISMRSYSPTHTATIKTLIEAHAWPSFPSDRAKRICW